MRAHDRALAPQAHDWGARVELSSDVAAHFMPAYHWSARGLNDRRMALWCAFLIETPDGALYCIGDTGFGDGAIFRAAKEKFGAPRLALIPIGAYEPRWFMKDQHIDPAEAVDVFKLCGARQAIAHHWGTFPLSNEGIDAPPKALSEALKRAAIEEERFRVMRPGEVFEEAAVSSHSSSDGAVHPS
jgi:L-ascorbate metabolism protein UlaG (beta-lactamase superfamily)